jgi:hypothetical protein
MNTARQEPHQNSEDFFNMDKQDAQDKPEAQSPGPPA